VKVYGNISIYPYAVDFDASSKKRVVSISVSNPSNERKTYRVSVIDMKQGITGGFKEIPADKRPEFSAAPFIAFSPKQFTLGPGEFQTVNISRKPMLNAPTGEYTSHLKIQEVDTPMPKEVTDSEGISAVLKFKYSITIPIYIRSGKTEGRVSISAAKLEERNGQQYISITLTREEGLKYFRGKIIATVNKNIVSEMKNMRLYPESHERIIFLPLNKGVTDLAGKKVKIIYQSDTDTDKKKEVFSEAEFTL
jgi:P pilus assembly chaperone PapD